MEEILPDPALDRLVCAARIGVTFVTRTGIAIIAKIRLYNAAGPNRIGGTAKVALKEGEVIKIHVAVSVQITKGPAPLVHGNTGRRIAADVVAVGYAVTIGVDTLGTKNSRATTVVVMTKPCASFIPNNVTTK